MHFLQTNKQKPAANWILSALVPLVAEVLIPSEIVLQITLGKDLFALKFIERREQITHTKDSAEQRNKILLVLLSNNLRLGA